MFVCLISIHRAVGRRQFPVDRQLRSSLSSQVNFLFFFQSELLLFFQSGLFTFFQSEHSLFQSLYLSKTKWLMRWDVFTSVQVSGDILWEIGSIKWLEDTLNNWKRQCIYKRWSELEWCDLELFGGWEQIIWAVKSRASNRSVYQRWPLRQDLEFKRSDWQKPGSNLKQFQKVRVRNIWAISEKGKYKWDENIIFIFQ